MQSAAVQVDVAAIRRGANRADFRARAPEQVRGQAGCRSIAAIESLVHGEFRRNGLDTGFKSAEDLLLDGLLFPVGKLIAAVAENLEAVILVRIVRGRDHHSSDEGIGVSKERDSWSGHDAG